MSNYDKEYLLDLNKGDNLVSSLEEITNSHTFGTGFVFSTSLFRVKFNQLPLKVGLISMSTEKDDSLNKNKLIDIVKNNLEPSVIVYRKRSDNSIYKTYFLPEAIEENPAKRLLRSGMHWDD